MPSRAGTRSKEKPPAKATPLQPALAGQRQPSASAAANGASLPSCLRPLTPGIRAKADWKSRPAIDRPKLARMSRSQRLTLVATILGSTIVFLDGTVVNVALPAIGDDLGAGLAGQQWVLESYLLALVAL